MKPAHIKTLMVCVMDINYVIILGQFNLGKLKVWKWLIISKPGKWVSAEITTFTVRSFQVVVSIYIKFWVAMLLLEISGISGNLYT